MRRRLILSLVPALALVIGCGDDAPNEFDSSGSNGESATATDTGTPSDLPVETGGQEADGDGDGDSGEGDGDGDGGDGDGDDSGDGDGDTGPGACGDGSVDIGEQCDGDNLNGFTCEDLGYSSGTLACDPVTCTYDASNCMTDPDGGSSGTTG